MTTDARSAKNAVDGALVTCDGDISTAIFPDEFYISHVVNGQQVSGIRVEKSGHDISSDKLVSVVGRIATAKDGERYIDAWSALAHESASIEPLFMNLKSLGGGSTLGGGQRGITDAQGLNNIGTFVRVCGCVTYCDEHTFTLQDGSNVNVICVTPKEITVNPLWRYVVVTGVSSIMKSNDTYIRLVKVTVVDPVIVDNGGQ
ncbi:MAG: hypothetical protein ABFD83_10210 [Armatimonadota bacterium]